MKDPNKKTPSTATANVSHAVKLRRRVITPTDPVGRTKESFNQDSDINTILARYKETGRLPDIIKENPKYGDFSDPIDYQDSLNLVIFADEQFNLLPAKVRDRFNNDPKTFLEFTADPENLPEMVNLGLAQQRTNQTNETEPAKEKPNTEKSKKDPKNEL